MGKKIVIGIVAVLVFIVVGSWLFWNVFVPSGVVDGGIDGGGKGLDLGSMYASVSLLNDLEVFSEKELEISLPQGEDYFDGMILNQTRKLIVECDECDKMGECNYICENECADKNMGYLTSLPFFGLDIEKEGECSCLCTFLVHINGLRFVQAIKNNDVDECEKIVLDVEGTIKKDYCYMNIAVILQDESACEKIIFDDNLKNQCLFRVALIKKDLSLCSNIEDLNPQWSKSLCEININSGKGDYYILPE